MYIQIKKHQITGKRKKSHCRDRKKLKIMNASSHLTLDFTLIIFSTFRKKIFLLNKVHCGMNCGFYQALMIKRR